MAKPILFIFLPLLLWTACGTSEHPTSNSTHLEDEYSEDYYLRITPDNIIMTDHKYFRYLISSKKLRMALGIFDEDPDLSLQEKTKQRM